MNTPTQGTRSVAHGASHPLGGIFGPSGFKHQAGERDAPPNAAEARLGTTCIHHSHQYGPNDVINAHAPEADPAHTASNGLREVFYNDQEAGVAPPPRGEPA